uniref:AzlD domain-containing protein n=1 Tax=Aquiluna sp. TaxID=2053504 RepID=UPI004048BA84
MILTVILASLAVYSWKLLGYLVPERFITERFREFSDRVTVALLAALVAIQGFSTEGEIVIDARLGALTVAAVLLAIRAPYILVVLAGALVAAGLRALGL